MASPEAWLRSAIEAGGDCPAYPVESDEGVLPPFVVFSLDDTDRLRDCSGPAGYTNSTFGLTIYANTYEEAVALSLGIIAAVDNFSGESHGATIESVTLADHSDGAPVKFEGRSKSSPTREQSYVILWKE